MTRYRGSKWYDHALGVGCLEPPLKLAAENELLFCCSIAQTTIGGYGLQLGIHLQKKKSTYLYTEAKTRCAVIVL